MRKSLDERADVAVVGGGVAGLAAARELARRGLRVVVLEAGEPGAGASGAAAGMLAPQVEADRPDELFELLSASRDMYPAFAERLREESGIDIELDRTGTLYLAFTEEDEEESERRFAWQSGAGLAVEQLTSREAHTLESQISSRVRSALLFPRDWQVENRLLVNALASSAAAFGARVFKGTKAMGVLVEEGRAAGVETSEGVLSAGAVVLAAGAWSSEFKKLEDESARGLSNKTGSGLNDDPRVEPVRGQMLCFRHRDSQTPFVWHVVQSPRGYVVPRRDGRLLAGSTTEHAGFDCRVTREGARLIRTHAEEIAPALDALDAVDSWAGLRPRAPDGLPVLGESRDVRGLFYATGYYRNGILLAPASGEIIAALVTGGATALPPHMLQAFAPRDGARSLAGSQRN
ncbi:MAG: glycine oxidase [Acidobacteriota bacterium]|jgi:glycine oxidase|nr:glycine oxidase [Acidobacteriota bacterium]